MQLDYVQAFSQAPIEKDLYLKVPAGFQVEYGDKNDYALKLHRNIYCQKESGRVWYKYLIKNLQMELEFTKSEIDECVFYRESVMYILYIYDSIITGPNLEELDAIVEDLKKANLVVTVEGTLEDLFVLKIAEEKMSSST